jgi:hypothetical protein
MEHVIQWIRTRDYHFTQWFNSLKVFHQGLGWALLCLLGLWSGVAWDGLLPIFQDTRGEVQVRCGKDKKENEYKLISVESPRAIGSGYDSSILQRQEA